MAFSQFFVLTNRGDTIVFRDFRGDCVRGVAEIFWRRLKKGEEEPLPFFNLDGINFVFIKRSSLYFVCTTKFNVSPLFAAELLTRAAGTFKDYCGVLSEESLRKNFVLVYELLDEILDYGYPQDTSTDHLKAYICNEAEVTAFSPTAASAGGAAGILSAITGAISTSEEPMHRTVSSSSAQKPIATGSRGQKNEIFVDLLERLTVLFSPTGQVIRSQIDGSIQMKSYLSGEPLMKLALNEDLVIGRRGGGTYGAVSLDDVTYHECVNLDEFETDRILNVRPIDGEFTAMSYRVSGEFRAPFRVFAFAEEVPDSALRYDVIVKIRADFPDLNHGNDIRVRVPMVKSTISASFDGVVGGQSGTFDKTNMVATWTIKKLVGGSEVQLRIRASTSAPLGPGWKKEVGPVTLEFEVPMYCCSGLNIRFLRLFERDRAYTPLRWVRYITHSDSYVCRIN